MLPTKWTIKEQSLFVNRLGVLLEHGYSLSEAIHFLSLQLKLKGKKWLALQACLSKLKNGESLSKALEQLGFHSMTISYAFYGEMNGDLALTLQTAGEILNKRNEEQTKIKRLLTYPLFLLIFTGMMFFVMQLAILPQFIQLYESFQADPGITLTFFIWINQHPMVIPIILIAFLIIFGFSLYFWKKKKTAYEFQIFLCRLPIVGSILKLWCTYYIAYQLSRLLKSGVSLLDSLQLMKNDPKRKYLNEVTNQINLDLLEGEQLHTAIRKVPIWQRELATVVEHGQLSGKLDIDLLTYSELCFQQFTHKIEGVTKTLQPLIFLIIGLWIIILYFLIMLPSFQLINNL